MRFGWVWLRKRPSRARFRTDQGCASSASPCKRRFCDCSGWGGSTRPSLKTAPPGRCGRAGWRCVVQSPRMSNVWRLGDGSHHHPRKWLTKRSSGDAGGRRRAAEVQAASFSSHTGQGPSGDERGSGRHQGGGGEREETERRQRGDWEEVLNRTWRGEKNAGPSTVDDVEVRAGFATKRSPEAHEVSREQRKWVKRRTTRTGGGGEGRSCGEGWRAETEEERRRDERST